MSNTYYNGHELDCESHSRLPCTCVSNTYKKGDTVKHSVWGLGTVAQIGGEFGPHDQSSVLMRPFTGYCLPRPEDSRYISPWIFPSAFKEKNVNMSTLKPLLATACFVARYFQRQDASKAERAKQAVLDVELLLKECGIEDPTSAGGK